MGSWREAHLVRSFGAVIAGFIAWFVIATLGNLVLRAAIPGYAALEATMAVTLSMQLGRLTVGLVSSFGAGAVCAAVARFRRWPVWLLAAILVLMFLPVHYALLQKFPLWYHAFFLITLAPAVLVGAWLVPLRADATG